MTGMGVFRLMETRGIVREKQREQLGDFCAAMAGGLAELVRQMSPRMTPRDVAELPLITMGAQLQGGNNNAIGQQALTDVFLAVREIVQSAIVGETERALTVLNAAGRTVTLTFASDPDIRIQETVGDKVQNKVAIEIKGGTDQSNAHNRAGEAEKSHLKAKGQGYRDFWTIIAKKGVDVTRLKSGSPTTRSWFDVAQVLGREGEDWSEFCAHLAGQVGIALSATSSGLGLATYEPEPSAPLKVAETPLPYGKRRPPGTAT